MKVHAYGNHGVGETQFVAPNRCRIQAHRECPFTGQIFRPLTMLWFIEFIKDVYSLYMSLICSSKIFRVHIYNSIDLRWHGTHLNPIPRTQICVHHPKKNVNAYGGVLKEWRWDELYLARNKPFHPHWYSIYLLLNHVFWRVMAGIRRMMLVCLYHFLDPSNSRILCVYIHI